MDYTTAQFNRYFKIMVYGVDPEGRKNNTLVGVSGSLRLIGIEWRYNAAQNIPGNKQVEVIRPC